MYKCIACSAAFAVCVRMCASTLLTCSVATQRAVYKIIIIIMSLDTFSANHSSDGSLIFEFLAVIHLCVVLSGEWSNFPAQMFATFLS